MSLTTLLDDKSSPIRKFLRTQFPNTRTFLAAPRKHLRKSYTIMPEAPDRYPWSTVGTALDYRIRYYFAVTPYEELVAYKGARRLTDDQLVTPSGRLDFRWTRNMDDAIIIFDRGTGKKVFTFFPDRNGGFGESGITDSVLFEAMALGSAVVSGDIAEPDNSTLSPQNQYRSFFCGLDNLTGRNPPVANRLPRAEEDELNRYCFVLALMEEVVRTGRLHGILATGEIRDAESLIGVAESHQIDDLRELSWKFYDRCNRLLRLPSVLNPRFDGSADVGGADADMIVGGTLIDIKTSRQGGIRSDWIWQLLGYVLLDYSDRHRIDSIGLYMARQGELIKWDLEDALRGLGSGEPPSIEELRSRFKELTQSAS